MNLIVSDFFLTWTTDNFLACPDICYLVSCLKLNYIKQVVLFLCVNMPRFSIK